MTTAAIEPARCRSCGTQLAPALRSCPSCRALVHANRLTHLAAAARAHEEAGRIDEAIAEWRAALELLPADAGQHAAIVERLEELEQRRRRATAAPRDASATAPHDPRRATIAGTGAALGGLALLLWKFKIVIPFLLTKGKLLLAALPKMGGMLLGLGGSLGLYWAAWGWQFAVGVIASIWVHEMGHVVAMRAFGIPASAPMFVPGLGAYVRMHRAPKNAREDARIGLAGPVGGLVAALAAVGLWLATGNPFFAAVAMFGAWINIFNLVPVWQLDGARAFRAFSRIDRVIAVLVLGAAWLFTRDGVLLLPALVGLYHLATPTPAASERDGASLALFTVLVGSLAALLTLPVPGLATP